MVDLPDIMLKYNGVFDYDNLLKAANGWLSGHQFFVQENKYKHSVPNAKGLRHEIGWKCSRQINAIIEYAISVDYLLWDIKDVEIVRNGKKVKMSHGKIKITLGGKVNVDYNNIFKGSTFIASVGIFFQKYIYGKDIGMIYADRLYYWMYKLHRVLKESLDMESKTDAFDWRY